MIGEMPTIRSRRFESCSVTPGTDSNGPMETTGLDGHTTMTSADPRASRTPGPGRAASDPSNRTPDTGTSWRSRTKYS